MKLLLVCSAVLLLGACATTKTYTVPSNVPTASLALDLHSVSTGTTSQSYRVFAYDDLNCTASRFGAPLKIVRFAEPSVKLEPIKIVAEAPLTFSILYGESRMAQNRQCSFTASFMPRSGDTYNILFQVAHGAQACGMKIFDKSNSEVSYESPLMSCAETFAGRVRNGGTGILDWKLKF